MEKEKECLQNNQLIFKCIVGSTAYGTAISGLSDKDVKGIYIQPASEHVCGKYKEEIEINKDEIYFEIKRYIELLQKANPTMLELIYMHDECIIETSSAFNILKDLKQHFLTKVCRDSFGGYAVAQIKKAKGLNKKMNWEDKKIEEKTIRDFIYIQDSGKTYPLQAWLEKNNLIENKCSIIGLNHFRECYALYYDIPNAKGIVDNSIKNIKVTSVPKEYENHLVNGIVLHFNKDGYKTYYKDWQSYSTWLKERNINRYVDVKNHDQKIDGKNLMHCRRLLDMAIEIAQTNNLSIKRNNREELLNIRKGEYDLQSIIDKAENDIILLDELYKNCSLPEKVTIDCQQLILDIRKEAGL